jgi:hypothetical protein
MNRSPCRLHVEELEQRAVPTPFFVGGHFFGCHTIRETIATGLNSTTSASGNIPSGLLRGKVALSNVMTSRSFITEKFAGTLTITTPLGTVRIQASGSVNLLTGSVHGFGTITRGTDAFRGVSGTLALQGKADDANNTLFGTLTGTICGPGAHHHGQARPG